MNYRFFILIIIPILVFSCTRERSQNSGETTIFTQEENIPQQEKIIQQVDTAILVYDENTLELGKSVLQYAYTSSNDIYASSDNKSDYNYRLRISDNEMTYSETIDDPESPEGEWRLIDKKENYNIIQEIVDNMLYINFYYDGEFLGKNVSHGQKRYLVLYLNSSRIYFFNETNECVWHIERGYENEFFSRSVAVASSELKEGNITYSSENLSNRFLLQPWVEGTAESGIGEKITFSPDTTSYWNKSPYSGILISNGYVDYNKPYLYEYNNRIKKIRVNGGNPNEYLYFELEDTPQLQKFDLEKNIHLDIKYLEIEIMEVYRGTRYDDTCINLILLWSSRMR